MELLGRLSWSNRGICAEQQLSCAGFLRDGGFFSQVVSGIARGVYRRRHHGLISGRFYIPILVIGRKIVYHACKEYIDGGYAKSGRYIWWRVYWKSHEFLSQTVEIIATGNGRPAICTVSDIQKI